MNPRQPCITESNYRRLIALLNQEELPLIVDIQTLKALRHRLATALIVVDAQVPATVVTMQSLIGIVDEKTGDRREFSLVYPHDADIATGLLSVCSPLGAKILGCYVGQILFANSRQLQIVEVIFQPESNSAFRKARSPGQHRCSYRRDTREGKLNLSCGGASASHTPSHGRP